MTAEEYTLGVRAELRSKSDEYGSLYYKCRLNDDFAVDHELTVFAFGTNETFKYPPLNPKAAAETIHARFTRELSAIVIAKDQPHTEAELCAKLKNRSIIMSRLSIGDPEYGFLIKEQTSDYEQLRNIFRERYQGTGPT